MLMRSPQDTQLGRAMEDLTADHVHAIRQLGMSVRAALLNHAVRESELVLPILMRNPPPTPTPPDFVPLPW